MAAPIQPPARRLTRSSMPAPLRVLKPSQQPLRGLEFDTGYVEPPGPIPPGPKQKKHEKKRKAAAGQVNSEDELRKKKRAEVPEWKRKEAARQTRKMKHQRMALGMREPDNGATGGNFKADPYRPDRHTKKKSNRASTRTAEDECPEGGDEVDGVDVVSGVDEVDEGVEVHDRRVDSGGGRTRYQRQRCGVNSHRDTLQGSNALKLDEDAEAKESLFVSEDDVSDEVDGEGYDPQGQRAPARPFLRPDSPQPSLSEENLAEAAESFKVLTETLPGKSSQHTQKEALKMLQSRIVCSTNFAKLQDHGEQWVNKTQRELESVDDKARPYLSIILSTARVLLALTKFFKAAVPRADVAGLHPFHKLLETHEESSGPFDAISHLKQQVGDIDDLDQLQELIKTNMTAKEAKIQAVPPTRTTDLIRAKTSLDSLRYLCAMVKEKQAFLANKKPAVPATLSTKQKAKKLFLSKLDECFDLDEVIKLSEDGVQTFAKCIEQATAKQRYVLGFRVYQQLSEVMLQTSKAAKAYKVQLVVDSRSDMGAVYGHCYLRADRAMEALEHTVATTVDPGKLRKVVAESIAKQAAEKAKREEILKSKSTTERQVVDALDAGFEFIQAMVNERNEVRPMPKDRA